MRTLAGWILCGAAIVAAIGPADASGLHAKRMRRHPEPRSLPTTDTSTHVLPYGTGIGSGTWQLPEAGHGFASLRLFDSAGRLAYLVRADLVRTGENPPPGMPEQGGFDGILILIESDGSQSLVAQVAGKWIREEDGSGSFGVDVLVAGSETRDHSMVSVGTIEGVLHGTRPGRGSTGTPGLRGSGVEGRPLPMLGRVTAAWTIDP